MKKLRIIALLCALILLASVFAPSALAAQEDTVYVRKHVSMVYDNSGSMSMDIGEADNLKWCYGSYAAQVFTGLLNDMDTLSVTFMNSRSGGVVQKSVTNTVRLDLTGDRAKQVQKVLEETSWAKGDTPLQSVYDALDELIGQGLLTDKQLAGKDAAEAEQFWLVLTTDGNLQDDNGVNLPVSAVEEALAGIMDEYSSLRLVYFGIGTAGDKSDQAAIDLRSSRKLNQYSNFTAYFADGQDKILSTMQDMANRIAGRYAVNENVKTDGSTVKLQISGESSPIRNIALLAQNTGAQLLSAKLENGTALRISRSAAVEYPQNPEYDQMPAGSKGGYTALITAESGKIPTGTVVLTFSEPVDGENLFLMYEPAIYVALNIQQKDSSGNWVDVPVGRKIPEGQTLRVTYTICEDGSDKPLDEKRLPGKTEAQITCNGKTIGVGESFTMTGDNAVLNANISMMDGAYRISTSRTISCARSGDYRAESGGGITLLQSELAENKEKAITFTVTCDGVAVTDKLMDMFTLDTGSLEGKVEKPGNGVIRFTPRQEDVQPGAYQVTLQMQGNPLASETVTVEEDVVTYTAKAGEDLALFNNALHSNTESVYFTVTASKNGKQSPLAQEDAKLFRVEAKSAAGDTLTGRTEYREDGQIHFIPTAGQPGDYRVSLWLEEEELARCNVCVMQYNATYTVEAVLPEDTTVQRFDLFHNQTKVKFIIRADGVPCTAEQLGAMLGSMIFVEKDPSNPLMRLEITVDEAKGVPAVSVRPTSKARNAFFAFWQRPAIAWGGVAGGELTLTLTVDAEKGDSARAALQIVNSVAEWVIYLLLFVIILAVLLLITWITICNIFMPRIKPGVLYFYDLKLNALSQYYISSYDSKRLRNLPRLKLTLKPQKCRNFCGVDFVAKGEACSLPFQTYMPGALLQGRNAALEPYTMAGSNPARTEFLELLYNGGGDVRRMRKANVNYLIPTMSVIDRARNADQETEYLPPMENGGFLVFKSRNGEGQLDGLKIWTFVPD